jgi:hypothetical protein
VPRLFPFYDDVSAAAIETTALTDIIPRSGRRGAFLGRGAALGRSALGWGLPAAAFHRALKGLDAGTGEILDLLQKLDELLHAVTLLV